MEGEDPDAQSAAAEALAAAGGLGLLCADVDALSSPGMAELLAREAFFKDELLIIDAHDGTAEAIAAGLRMLSAALETSPCLVALSCRRATGVLGDFHHPLVPLRFEADGPDARRARWQAAIASHDASVDPSAIERVSQRITLMPRCIEAAAATAVRAARVRAAKGPVKVDTRDLQEAACQFARRDLSALAQTIVPMATWDQLVSSPDALAQLREFCARIDSQRSSSQSLGIWAAHQLRQGDQCPVLRPIGNRQDDGGGNHRQRARPRPAEDRSLRGGQQVHRRDREEPRRGSSTRPRTRNAILFFDEADALFGKRSEVTDAHDRYANIEISYLLQQMETYDGRHDPGDQPPPEPGRGIHAPADLRGPFSVPVTPSSGARIWRGSSRRRFRWRRMSTSRFWRGVFRSAGARSRTPRWRRPRSRWASMRRSACVTCCMRCAANIRRWARR